MPDTIPSRGEKRRTEILRAARTLFNRHGTAAVSTNHIAAELEISVGNLYWHFRDKAAIVRALFDELRGRFDAAWSPPETLEAALAAAVAGMRESFTSAWDYRFFYREIGPLTHADPELHELVRQVREKRREEVRAFLGALAAHGILCFASAEELDRVEELGWLVATFWVPHVDVRDGALTKRAVQQGVSALLAVYLPHAAPEHAEWLRHALIEKGPET